MVNDIPAHDPAVHPLWDVRCRDCGTLSNPPTVVVGRFPDPTIADPRDSRRRCQDCYADLLTEETPLEGTAARVIALQLAGYSHDQIGVVLGRATTRIKTIAKKVRDDARRAPNGSQHLTRIHTYL